MMSNTACFKFAPMQKSIGALLAQLAQKISAPTTKIPIVNIGWRNAPPVPIAIGALLAHFAGSTNVYDKIGIADFGAGKW